MTDLQNNIANIKKHIQDTALLYDRAPDAVRLLAASKNQSLESIQAAIDAGQYAFGENYLQEALSKIAALKDPRIEWHFIGPIQSNKTKSIAEHFAWVHSVADIKIAQRLNDQRPATLPPLNICLQVNISQEATKSGVHPDALLALATACQTLPRLTLRGLMTLPAPASSLAAQRIPFHALQLLWQACRDNNITLDTLSMGTSDDMEAAIAEGATIVRIGTAVFGHRSRP